MKSKKNIIFISDFDGTITKKDFYWILLDDYIGKKGIDYYNDWKKDKKIGTEFLNTIFSWYEFSEKEHIEALNKVDVDQDMLVVKQLIAEKGGEFIILSAGFKYYIDYVLEKLEINDIKVLTNGGTFKKGKFIMEPNKQSKYYSEIYGIDKEKVAIDYREECETLIYAGDSEPDLLAAKQADIIFAKNELAELLEKEKIPYYKYITFNDIFKKLFSLA